MKHNIQFCKGKINQNPNLGQHFLVDKNILGEFVKICDIKSEDKIIEIGAGTGILTKAILEKNPKKIIAFEVDKKFFDDLNGLTKKNQNLEIVFGDAVKQPWKNCNKICASIPYYLSESIILKAIENPEIKEIFLITGENFKKTLEEKTEKIGILANLYYKIKPVKKISKEAFNPVPRVNSWIIALERKKEFENKTEEILTNILKSKGKIKNAILYSLVKEGKTKNSAREMIEKMNLNKETLEKPVASITGKFLEMIEEKLGEQK